MASLSTAASAPMLNVLEFGAVGNGSTLDTAAIQTTANAARAGQTIVLPQGYNFLVDTSAARSHNFAGVGSEFYAFDVPNGVIVQVDGTLTLPYADVGFPHSCIALMNQTISAGFTLTGSGTLDGAGTGVTAENLHWGTYCSGKGSSLTIGSQLAFRGWRGKGVNVLAGSTGNVASCTLGACLIHEASHGNGFVIAGCDVATINGTQVKDSYIPGGAEAVILGVITTLTMTNVISTNWGNLGLIGAIGSAATFSTIGNCSFQQPAAGGAAAINIGSQTLQNVTISYLAGDAAATATQRGFSADGGLMLQTIFAHCTGYGGATPPGGYRNRINPATGTGSSVCAFTGVGSGTDFVTIPTSESC